jgi:hypothetical protein
VTVAIQRVTKNIFAPVVDGEENNRSFVGQTVTVRHDDEFLR